MDTPNAGDEKLSQSARLQAGLKKFAQIPLSALIGLVVDGKMLAEENGAEGWEIREPGSVNAALDGFAEALQTIHQEFDSNILRAIHQACSSYDALSAHSGKFRQRNNIHHGSFYKISREAFQAQMLHAWQQFREMNEFQIGKSAIWVEGAFNKIQVILKLNASINADAITQLKAGEAVPYTFSSEILAQTYSDTISLTEFEEMQRSFEDIPISDKLLFIECVCAKENAKLNEILAPLRQALNTCQTEAEVIKFADEQYAFFTCSEMYTISWGMPDAAILTFLLDSAFKTYREQISQAQDETTRLAAIVALTCKILRSHPFEDCNARVCMIVLNNCLIQQGYAPAMLFDPLAFVVAAPEELLKMVLEGIEATEQVIAGAQVIYGYNFAEARENNQSYAVSLKNPNAFFKTAHSNSSHGQISKSKKFFAYA